MEKLAGEKASLRLRLADALQRWSEALRGVEFKAQSGTLLDFPAVGGWVLGRPVLHVMSRRGGFQIGTIKWSNQWNKPSFKADSEAVFDQRCIAEIYAAMKQLK